MSTAHKLRIPDDLVRLIRKMHPQLKGKVRAALDEITRNPDSGKVLKFELLGLRSYRVGRMKIIYRTGNHRIIELVAIGPRKTIYEETYRLINQDSQAKLG